MCISAQVTFHFTNGIVRICDSLFIWRIVELKASELKGREPILSVTTWTLPGSYFITVSEVQPSLSAEVDKVKYVVSPIDTGYWPK